MRPPHPNISHNTWLGCRISKTDRIFFRVNNMALGNSTISLPSFSMKSLKTADHNLTLKTFPTLLFKTTCWCQIMLNLPGPPGAFCGKTDCEVGLTWEQRVEYYLFIIIIYKIILRLLLATILILCEGKRNCLQSSESMASSQQFFFSPLAILTDKHLRLKVIF